MCHKCHLKCCPRLCFRMSLFKYIFLRNTNSQVQMRQREEDMKWGVRNTSHGVQQPCGSCGHMILWSTWIHGGCEHSSTLPGKRHSAVLFFGLLLLLLSQAIVPITPHHGRKSCCSCCCQGTEITAVNVLPGTMCAAASSMLSSLGTDRHKLIQFSN